MSSGELLRPHSPADAIHSAVQAEHYGFESILIPVSQRCMDPLILAALLGRETERIEIVAAIRPGLLNPATTARSIATLVLLNSGRVGINLVEGSLVECENEGDRISNSDREDRRLEFCEIMDALWQRGQFSKSSKFYGIKNARMPCGLRRGRQPRMYISGHSESAVELAAKYGSFLLVFGASLNKIKERISVIDKINNELKKEVRLGMAINIISRDTREEAHQYAMKYISKVSETHLKRVAEFRVKHPILDGIEFEVLRRNNYWWDDVLWYGMAKGKTHQTASLVGSHDDVAQRLIEYYRVGVDHFILTGDPNDCEVHTIGSHLLPRVRLMAGSHSS